MSKKHTREHVNETECFINLDTRLSDTPFKQLSREQIDQLICRIRCESQESFEKNLVELRAILARVDAVAVMSHFCFYDLLLLDQPGRDRRSDYEPLGIAEVEFLQALVLMAPLPSTPLPPPQPGEIQQIHDLTRGLWQSFFLKRFEPGSHIDEQFSRKYVVELMRAQTQDIRNWGVGGQVFRLTHDMIAPLDADCETCLGVGCARAVTFFENLANAMGARLNSYWSQLRPSLSQDTVEKVVRRYCEAIGDSSGTEQMLSFARKRGFDVQQTKLVLMQHSTMTRLPRVMFFSLDELKKLFPRDEGRERLGELLDACSLSFGDLAASDPQHFLLDNPTWSRPFIRLPNGHFFLPNVTALQAHVLDMVEAFLSKSPEVQARYWTRRAEFLEAATAEHFQKAIPKARVYRKIKYPDENGDECENDVLVLIDSYALVVECKSGHVSPKGRRGEPQRFERHMEDLIEEPATQALRFARYIRAHETEGFIPCLDREPVELDKTPLPRRVIPVTVTFEVLGALTGNKKRLAGAGFVSPDSAGVLSLALPDLEIVFSMLPTTSHRLHYIERRAELEARLELLADERDMLTFYLDNGFNIGELEFNHKGLVHLYGTSHELDEYLVGQECGLVKPKPVPKMTQWWKDMLRRVEDRSLPGWTILGTTLLYVPFGNQREFEATFKKTVKHVKGHWHEDGHTNTQIMVVGPSARRHAFVALAYKRVDREKRENMIMEATGRAGSHSTDKRALIIATDAEKPGYPYDLLCYMDSSQPRDNSPGETSEDGG